MQGMSAQGSGVVGQEGWEQGPSVLLKYFPSRRNAREIDELVASSQQTSTDWVALHSSVTAGLLWVLRTAVATSASRLWSESNVEQPSVRAELVGQLSTTSLFLRTPIVGASGRRISTEATAALKDIESEGVDVRDWLGLAAYLTENDALQKVAVDTIREVRRNFPEAPLSFELYRDPEIAQYRYPIIYIHVAKLDDECFGKLEHIGQAIDRMLVGKSGWLAVDLKSTL